MRRMDAVSWFILFALTIAACIVASSPRCDDRFGGIGGLDELSNVIIAQGEYEPVVYKADYSDNEVIYGVASYYAHRFHNRVTANGEIFNMYDMTVAHRNLPFGTVVLITNLSNSRSVIARVNDRGPYIYDREIDLSLGVAEKLDMVYDGLEMVCIEIIGRVDERCDDWGV